MCVHCRMHPRIRSDDRRCTYAPWGVCLLLDDCDAELSNLINRYVAELALPTDELMVTTSRATYRKWIGRLVPASYGGAYCFVRRTRRHAVLINLQRIDTDKPRALELVVAEELIHMRDRLDGDRRRHAHHGYDRIAHRVAAVTGASLDEIRSTLKPVQRRPVKYLYRCPGCGLTVGRRRQGIWSCSRCAPGFDRQFQMRIVREHPPPGDGVV